MMTLSEFFEVASFCVANPSMLFRNYWGNRKEAQKIDALIDILIENKDRVTICGIFNDCRLVLEFEGNFYCFWVANKFYSYLDSGKCSATLEEASLLTEHPDWDEILPSRLRAIRFYKAFDIPVKQQPSIKRNHLLLPAKSATQDAFYNHPDEITARKYMQRDPETLKRLGVFDPSI